MSGTKITASIEVTLYSENQLDNDYEAKGFIKCLLQDEDWEGTNIVVFKREPWEPEEIDDETELDLDEDE